MRKLFLTRFLPAFFYIWFAAISVATSRAADWKVGVSKTVITPEVPVQLVGYGGRKNPFSGVDIDIYAKALAFQDQQGHRGIIVTADLVGFQDVFFGPVCERVMKKTGLSRAQIMLNASHNHTGPLMSLKPDRQGNVAYFAFNEEESQRVVDYTKGLQEKIYQLMLAALNDLQPADLSWGTDRVSFVMNRRIKTKDGVIRMGPNPDGPADSVVPVLKVAAANGEIRALLFGCACHNTGLTGDHNVITGDYAGYAQEILERRYPGAIALFKAGCGADANPEPRTDIAGVRILGLELADAVTRALASKLKPIHGELRFALRKTDLPLKTYQPGQVEAMAAEKDVVGLMAKHLWKVLQSGTTLRTKYPAHIAAWAFGDDLTLVAFPSETVAEYALNLRSEYPNDPLWVSGYNNDLFGYVPTAQIVREGGHETIGVTTWLWGTDLADQVGFFSEEVEQVMMETARELIEELKVASSR
ncbi:MAG: hypothetical protein GXP26_15015 [Planctomycetes bacterium]|nr:hypothetical protein [Planctomycetota bacterium]